MPDAVDRPGRPVRVTRRATMPAAPQPARRRALRAGLGACLAAALRPAPATAQPNGSTGARLDGSTGPRPNGSTSAQPNGSTGSQSAGVTTTKAAGPGAAPPGPSGAPTGPSGAPTGPATAQPLPPELARLAQRLARGGARRAAFVERKHSSLLRAPLESRGTLAFRPPDRLQRVVDAPRREVVTIEGGSVTIEAADGKPPRTVRLDAYPALAAFAESLRATLAGDFATLQQYFSIAMDGSVEAWTLALDPFDATLRQAVERIQVRGRGGDVDRIDILEPGGDRTELLLGAPGGR